jgi:acetyl-CoA decarbonylase/synthase complex subunit gamma
MAMTGMQIYKNLPKTNCKDCGLPTCMAFAMQVAAKQRALTDCPHVAEEAKAAMSEASAPPMRLVKIGPEGASFDIGQETVMFRHEEKFHRPAGIAVRVPASLSDAEAAARLAEIGKRSFLRVGKTLKVALAAVELEGAGAAARAGLAAQHSPVPLVLMGKTEALLAGAEAAKGKRPLLYKADSGSLEALAKAAAAARCPLAVGAPTLEELADLSGKAKALGAEDLVLAFSGSPAQIIRSLTVARRAGLKKGFRPFGYPALVEVAASSPELEGLLASSFAAKYAGIVIVGGLEPWELLPILVTVQDVYTDPQVPNAVEAKLYELGSPNENSPVLFTTNFSLTYFSVAGEVERSKVPAYICVVETEGLGVLNAYAGDKISAEKVVKTIQAQKVAEKVKHRRLIIPGLLPIFRAEIEDTSEWKEVIIGPENSRELPAFLQKMAK